MNNQQILNLVQREHERQLSLGFDIEHDNQHASQHWVPLLAKQVGDLAYRSVFDIDAHGEPVEPSYSDVLIQLITVALKAAGWDGTPLREVPSDHEAVT